MKRVLGAIRRADEKYHLIEEDDKICIGVSGGKDSLLLMRALKLYQRFSKAKFDVCAVMLDLGLKYQNTKPIYDYAEQIGIPFEVIPTEIGKVVFEYRRPELRWLFMFQIIGTVLCIALLCGVTIRKLGVRS